MSNRWPGGLIRKTPVTPTGPFQTGTASGVWSLADASYWMYLIHVPLIIVAQLLVREWPLPANVKFLLILATVMPILLATYRWCVRFTPIGRLLNGPRDVSTASQGR